MAATTTRDLLGGATRRYVVLDVFTDRSFAGNPLAVVLDAEDLDAGQLQQLAREFNLSETAFPLRPTGPGADYRLRIFTPAAELPFAGHPSIGTAWLLRALGRLPAGSDRFVQECGAGLLPVAFAADGTVTLTGATPVVSEPLDPAPLLAAVELDDSARAPGRPRRAGTGIDFHVLTVQPGRSSQARPHLGRLDALRSVGLVLVEWDPDARRGEVRVFAGGFGVPEDPATGSAATALGAYLVAEGLLPADGEHSFELSQGVVMGRPSRLTVGVTAVHGRALECRVAGRAVPVAHGEVSVPGAGPAG